MHGGLTDPRELGRLGGRGRTRKMLGLSDHIADESLREKARRRLEQILEGDDEAAALRAATALYSDRAAPAPEGQRDELNHHVPMKSDGRPPTSLADVVHFALVAHGRTICRPTWSPPAATS
jgi:hypothetical protein